MLTNADECRRMSSGTALSLVGPEEVARIEGLAAKQAARGLAVVQPLPFNLAQVEGFRYRAEEVYADVR